MHQLTWRLSHTNLGAILSKEIDLDSGSYASYEYLLKRQMHLSSLATMSTIYKCFRYVISIVTLLMVFCSTINVSGKCSFLLQSQITIFSYLKRSDPCFFSCGPRFLAKLAENGTKILQILHPAFATYGRSKWQKKAEKSPKICTLYFATYKRRKWQKKAGNPPKLCTLHVATFKNNGSLTTLETFLKLCFGHFT